MFCLLGSALFEFISKSLLNNVGSVWYERICSKFCEIIKLRDDAIKAIKNRKWLVSSGMLQTRVGNVKTESIMCT